MRFRQHLTCLLLGYLVLLLNFGPSLHYAPIFGLHAHGHCPHSHSSCCHSHSHNGCQAASSEIHDDQPANDLIDSDHDCDFCKFYDQYNVVVVEFCYTQSVAAVLICDADKPHLGFAAILIPAARGPPSRC